MAFAAMYQGWCPECDSDIKVGEMIESLPDSEDAHYRHAECPTLVADSSLEKPCPKCFLIHNGACF